MTEFQTKLGFQSYFKEFNSVYFIFIMVAFTQGILQLSDLGINFLYKDDYKLKPAQVSMVLGLTSLPWIFKPLWGILCDSYYFCGYRRKSYLLLFSTLQSILWLLLAFWAQGPVEGVFILILIQVCISFNNVIGEALLVQISRDQPSKQEYTEQQKQNQASKNVSLFFSTKSLGSFLTAYTGGVLLEYLNKKTIFAITSIFPMILACGAIMMHEQHENYVEPGTDPEDEKLIKELRKKNAENEISNIKKVYVFLQKPEILKPIGFIFIFMATPSTGSSMFYFYTNELKFMPEFMGELKLVHSLAHILGIFIYHKFLKHIPFKKLFSTSLIICSFTGLSQIILVTRYNKQLGIPDQVFSICDSMIIQTFGEINTIPLLVLACRLCPKNIEGTMYALLMSTINCGSIIAFQLGGILIQILGITDTNFKNLWILILIANMSMLLPLPLLYFVDLDVASKVAEDHKKLKEDDDLGDLDENEPLHPQAIDAAHKIEVQDNQEIKDEDCVSLFQNKDACQSTLYAISEYDDDEIMLQKFFEEIQNARSNYQDGIQKVQNWLDQVPLYEHDDVDFIDH